MDFANSIGLKDNGYCWVSNYHMAYALQRQLQFGGMQTVALHIRMTMG